MARAAETLSRDSDFIDCALRTPAAGLETEDVLIEPSVTVADEDEAVADNDDVADDDEEVTTLLLTLELAVTEELLLLD